MTIRIPTVLILGAGASNHCDYPLGTPLISDVVSSNRERHISLPTDWEKEAVDKFVTRMSRSAHDSIDAFLESVPEHTDLGKYLIAYRLKYRENTNRLFPPHNSGWYKYLFQKLLGDKSSPFDDNELSIVTFNYDRSLEAYLYYALIARFDMSEREAAAELQKIPIIHVHGMLGTFPEVPYEAKFTVESILEISRSINIIHEIQENENEFCSVDFERASKAIKKASIVIFLGFGFHPDNIRRLNVDWSEVSKRKLLSTFYGINQVEHEELTLKISGYGLTRNNLPFNGPHDCTSFFRHVISLQ